MAENTTELQAPPMNVAVIAMQEVLQQNRDIRGGRKAIHINKKLYFTQLDEQTDDQFNSMVEMAPVYVLYPKVVDGFIGTIFAKEPVLSGVTLSEENKKQNANVDLLGNSIDKFSENVVNEVIENGFCATMNDYSESQRRPFIRLIKPSQFISFRTGSDEGYPKLVQFIFVEEIEEVDPENEFDTISKNQYTVLDFAPNPKNNNKVNCRVRIYASINQKELVNSTDGKTEKIVLKSTNFPIKKQKYFETMPITIHGIDSNNYSIQKSLLQDVSDMNISVMQRTVDQVYMLHWTALPTPWVTGGEEDSMITIGPSKALHIVNPDAKVGMLEFSGNSARAHQDYIDNLLFIMATIGAQILKKEGVSRETATSVLVRSAAQTSLVATMVKNVSGQLESTLAIYLDWSGVIMNADYSYKLNDDFIKVDMEPNAQIALVKSWLDGAISHQSIFDKMKEGELVPTNRTFEQELELINKNPPPFFDKEIDQKNALAVADAAFKANPDGGDGNTDTPPNKDDTKGSSLENGNVNNPQATED